MQPEIPYMHAEQDSHTPPNGGDGRRVVSCGESEDTDSDHPSEEDWLHLDNGSDICSPYLAAYTEEAFELVASGSDPIHSYGRTEGAMETQAAVHSLLDRALLFGRNPLNHDSFQMSRTVVTALEMNDTLNVEALAIVGAKLVDLLVQDHCHLRAAVFPATADLQGLLHSEHGTANAERQELKCLICASGIFGLQFRNDQGCTLFMARPLEGCNEDATEHPLVGRCGHNTCIAALLKHQKQILTGTWIWSRDGAPEINVDYDFVKTPMNKIIRDVEAASTPEGINKFKVLSKKLTELLANWPEGGDVSLHQLDLDDPVEDWAVSSNWVPNHINLYGKTLVGIQVTSTADFTWPGVSQYAIMQLGNVAARLTGTHGVLLARNTAPVSPSVCKFMMILSVHDEVSSKVTEILTGYRRTCLNAAWQSFVVPREIYEELAINAGLDPATVLSNRNIPPS
jgi:hypothetical protein